MDNSVHASLTPEEQERLTRLREELEGQELTVLLERLQQRSGLSVNQMAVAAGMDESALHKILNGENREFKAEHVNALLDDLEQQGKFANAYERAIWQRALRVAAFLHFDLYKAVEPRLHQIPEPGKRLDALKAYLRKQYPALAETYDKSGGTFPIFVPLIDIAARELNKRWGWIHIPQGYKLNRIEGDRYYLISKDFFPKKITDLGPELEVKDTGFGTYTIKRRIAQPQPAQTVPRQPEGSKPNFERWGGIEFVRIPQGQFIMGSRHNANIDHPHEMPQHMVDLPYAYWIGRYPVTNDQFSAFVKATGYRTTAEHEKSEWTWWQRPEPNTTIWDKGNHPVVLVSWHDAMAYCKWLNTLIRAENPNQELVARLPTEAEWEKAARGEFGNEWPWGNEFDKNRCNSGEDGKGGTTPVDAYSPQGDSPFGVADMAGNVWEWCHSSYQPYPYSATDGREDESGSGVRMQRGGAFTANLRGVRATSRIPVNIELHAANGGFRVVLAPGLS